MRSPEDIDASVVERYTDFAKMAVIRGQQIAVLRGHVEYGTADLLAGLLVIPHSHITVARQTLLNVGLDSRAQGNILEVNLDVERGERTYWPSDAAREVLTEGVPNVGKKLGHAYFGTEHMLLAVAEYAWMHPEDEAAQLLIRAGVQPDQIIGEVLFNLSGGYGMFGTGTGVVELDRTILVNDYISRNL